VGTDQTAHDFGPGGVPPAFFYAPGVRGGWGESGRLDEDGQRATGATLERGLRASFFFWGLAAYRPRDTALSNFQQNFKARHGGLGYAFDLAKTGRQINDYHRLMEHWRAALPLDMFDLQYESMVQDQEGTTRALLEFVGVDWDEHVRDFHKTERAVRTASVTQVRQPIYATSAQKWRRYERHLAPLLAVLDPAVTAPYDTAAREDKASHHG